MTRRCRRHCRYGARDCVCYDVRTIVHRNEESMFDLLALRSELRCAGADRMLLEKMLMVVLVMMMVMGRDTSLPFCRTAAN